jgi:mercuric ion transport protein
MYHVTLIYDPDCPNVEAARQALREALTQSGEPPAWQEWNRADPASPSSARQYGSPTILVNGEDVAGAAPVQADCCRVYADPAGQLRGVPAVGVILTGLRRALHDDKEHA